MLLGYVYLVKVPTMAFDLRDEFATFVVLLIMLPLRCYLDD